MIVGRVLFKGHHELMSMSLQVFGSPVLAQYIFTTDSATYILNAKRSFVRGSFVVVVVFTYSTVVPYSSIAHMQLRKIRTTNTSRDTHHGHYKGRSTSTGTLRPHTKVLTRYP